MSSNQLILDYYRRRDKQSLEFLQSELNQKIEVLNKFFDEYLDLFSDKMSATESSDPVWQAYKDKLKECEIAKADLKLTEYYLGMI